MTMSKNSRITVAVAFALSVGVTFTIIKLKAPASKSLGSPLTSLPTPAVSAPAADKLYQDESGFSFKYPSDLTISDDTPDDDVYYSRLKLKKADGTMLELSIKDISYDSIDSWSAKELKSSTPAGSLDFGKISAKQFRLTGRLVTAAVAGKILYQLQSPDNDYWQKIHRQIAVSFVEGVVPAESAAGQSPASDTIYEAEEVVE